MSDKNVNPQFTPLLQFLFFDDCPLAEAARESLEKALQLCDIDIDQYEIIDLLDARTPANLIGWGSPTILINGEDVTGCAKGDGIGCRVYQTVDKVPTVAIITAAIRNESQRTS